MLKRFRRLTSKMKNTPYHFVLIVPLHQRKGLFPLLNESSCRLNVIIHSHGMCVPSIFCIAVMHIISIFATQSSFFSKIRNCIVNENPVNLFRPNQELLLIPPTRMVKKTLGARVFAAPTLWDKLPLHITGRPILVCIKKYV